MAWRLKAYGNQINLKKFDFIYSGGITELRGAFKILKAVKLAKHNLSNIKVVFVGSYSPEGLKDKLQGFINTNNLNNNVELHSYVNYNEISNYYNSSKVGLVTLFKIKTFEVSMPIKVFEYMAFGLPIIGSDFGHIKKYVENENCGLLVDPLSESEISKAMVKLIQDKELYAELSKNGRKATLERYKWDFELEKLVNYYSKALKKRNS